MAMAAGLAAAATAPSQGQIDIGHAHSWGSNPGTSRPASERFSAVTAGYRFSAALRHDGQIVAWGSNEAGSSGSHGGQLDVPSVIPEFTQIAAGYYHMSGIEGCYANCDGGLEPPFYSANDFLCFNHRFAIGDPWANCTGATEDPILTVNDFTCFTNRYVDCSEEP